MRYFLLVFCIANLNISEHLLLVNNLTVTVMNKRTSNDIVLLQLPHA